MQVILDSFRMAPTHNSQSDLMFSVARWQPVKCSYNTLRFLAPFGLQGLEPESYRIEYNKILDKVRMTFITILDRHIDDTISLLCWCNPDRQKKYEKLMCHTILIGYEIESLFKAGKLKCKELKVVYEDGRDNPVWDRLASPTLAPVQE